MIYLIHVSQDFVACTPLLMFSMSLGGMKASTIVQVKELLYQTWSGEMSDWALWHSLLELQGWAGEEEGVLSRSVAPGALWRWCGWVPPKKERLAA